VPIAGSYTVSLVLVNDAGFGNGSIAFNDGGSTDISYSSSSPTPEPSSIMLLGSGAIGVAGLLRRKFGK